MVKAGCIHNGLRPPDRDNVTLPLEVSLLQVQQAQLALGGSDTWFAAILERTSYWFKFAMNRNL